MKLALGTVQFGLSYGITNNSGQVQEKEVCSILEHATQKNINILDTAAAYGNSETVLGNMPTQNFDIISKIPSVSKLKVTIADCLSESLRKLKRKSIYGLMFHDENDIISTKGYFEALITAKTNGLVQKIGCSFYTVEALKKSLEMDHALDLIQIPANCFDQRFLKSGLLDEAKSQGIEIHCRSLFLQGLLLDRNATLPKSLSPFKDELDSFFKFCEFYNISPLMATLKYLQQTEVFDYGVVGCVTTCQLDEITTAYEKINQYDELIDFSKLSSTNTILLNPTLWN